MNEERNVGWVGIAVPDKAGGVLGRVYGCLKDKSIRRGVTKRIDSFDADAIAFLSTRQPDQAYVRDVPIVVENLKISATPRKTEFSGGPLGRTLNLYRL